MTTLPNGETKVAARSRSTMRDVAALAGVSIKTVSRVINQEPGVSGRLSFKVFDAVDRLDYRHDFAASALRRTDRRSSTIGLVLKNVANPFSSSLHRAIEEQARDRNVLVLAGSSDEDPDRERSLIGNFAGRRVDGLIIVPTGPDQSYLMTERRAGTGIVFVDRTPTFFDADCVLTDNEQGTRQGVRHLIENGHTKIAYLGDLQTIVTAQLRLQGFRQEMLAAGIRVNDQYVKLNLGDEEIARATMLDMFSNDDPPTAVFASQNLLTIGAVRALRSLQLHDRVALVGFDDILMADLLQPALTVVAQDPVVIGRTSADLLFRRLDGDTAPTQHLVIASQLIVRGSGEIRPEGSR